jgi:hypothetical protein
MNKTTDSDRLDQLERDQERLKRAFAALASGVDWSAQRGGRSRGDVMRSICAEVDAANDAEALKLRHAALETELAALRAA